ncbi:unnamed protein product [Penicillium salamii]|uniref:Zn(2)-C6 fungal-type domain-containing protein n=1 Tax=Penicillium salamii TaxID=1612424 RepID=A0A9W4JUV7_9EURO|nr:unnamed protein product [Penicillium salamii]
MELSCSDVPRTAAHLTQSGTQRQRIRQACKQCHLLKAKCSGTSPACQRCCKKGISCEYTVSKPLRKTRKRRRALPYLEKQPTTPLSPPLKSPEHTYEQSSSGNIGTELASMGSHVTHKDQHRNKDVDTCEGLGLQKTIVRLYIDAYFEYISPLCENGFIHRALFLRAWTSGKVDPVLLKAICSASADFVPANSAASTRRDGWLSEAESYIWSNIGRPSIAILQVLVIVISQNLALSRFSALQPLLAVAAKMAYLLRLNHENPKLSTTAREIRRRLMWSIFILERRLAGGQEDLITCPKNLMHIQLPSTEKDFELAISSRTGPLVPTKIDRESSGMGIRAYFCRLSSIRHEILQYTRRVISEGANANDTSSELLQLESDLVNFKNSLPEALALNERNLNLRAFSPQMRRYVMLHAAWHQCHCDLYRFMIPGLRDSLSGEALRNTSSEFMMYCQAQAVNHANALVDLLQMVQRIGDEMMQDPGIKVLVYQCTRIITRASDIGLLGTKPERLETLSKLTSAAEILLPIIAINHSTSQLVSYTADFIGKTLLLSCRIRCLQMTRNMLIMITIKYQEIQELISTAAARASDPSTVTPASEAKRISDANILDILAQIRQNDINEGENVHQHHPISPPTTATTSHDVGVPSREATDNDNRVHLVESPMGEGDIGEQLWYTGLESEDLFGSGSIANLFDGFGGSAPDFAFHGVDQLYEERF